MVLLIILTLFALLVLAFGFLEIKIPFVSVMKDLKTSSKPEIKQSANIKDKLVKNSIEHTIRTTKLLKERFYEETLPVEEEY